MCSLPAKAMTISSRQSQLLRKRNSKSWLQVSRTLGALNKSVALRTPTRKRTRAVTTKRMVAPSSLQLRRPPGWHRMARAPQRWKSIVTRMMMTTIMRMMKISMRQARYARAAKMTQSRSRCPWRVTRRQMKTNLSRSKMRTM